MVQIRKYKLLIIFICLVSIQQIIQSCTDYYFMLVPRIENDGTYYNVDKDTIEISTDVLKLKLDAFAMGNDKIFTSFIDFHLTVDPQRNITMNPDSIFISDSLNNRFLPRITIKVDDEFIEEDLKELELSANKTYFISLEFYNIELYIMLPVSLNIRDISVVGTNNVLSFSDLKFGSP